MESGTVWFTGFSGAGKSTVAATLKQLLDGAGVTSVVLDGDDLRRGLSLDLGYSDEDRQENIRRVGEVALLFARAGLLSLVTVISPFSAGRDHVRARHVADGVPFVEVHVATPLETCEQRDPKGLYARARRGEVKAFTGISSPYEPPAHPELVLSTTERTPQEAAAEVLDVLSTAGLIPILRQ